MARTTNVVMSLETLYTYTQTPSDTPTTDGPLGPGGVHVWPVFFKIDGTTAQVSDGGKLTGTASVSGNAGVGPVCSLVDGFSTVFPSEVSQWSDQVAAIPLPPSLAGFRPDVGGVFGVALVLVKPGNLESDALVAGHAAFNESMQTALNDLIANLPPLQADVGPEQIDPLVKAVRGAIDKAVHNAMGFWDKVHTFFGKPDFMSTFAHFSQDDLPAADFDQKDFDPGSDNGPALISWRTGPFPHVSAVGVNGAIARSRRTVGQGVLRQFAPPVLAVAGFTSADGIQHAVAATGDGAVTEMWWQGPGQVGSGVLTRFSSKIVGLAGYSAVDGYQHVIVATDDGTVSEVYWRGPNPPGQGSLSHFDNRILAIAGYASADGYQNVIVATNDGNLSQLWWQTGAVGRGTLSHLGSIVVDLAGYEADGVHHVIAATADGALTELTWSGAAAATASTLAQVEAQPWNYVFGVGAYAAAQEHHVIVGMSNGTLREFHVSAVAQPQLLHTDLAIVSGIVPIIDAYSEASGDQHTIVATTDGAVHEIWWSPAEVLLHPVIPAGGRPGGGPRPRPVSLG